MEVSIFTNRNCMTAVWVRLHRKSVTKILGRHTGCPILILILIYSVLTIFMPDKTN